MTETTQVPDVHSYQLGTSRPALAWVRGYRSARDLSTADEQEIPTFVMLRRLALVAWIGSHHDTELARQMGKEFTPGFL